MSVEAQSKFCNLWNIDVNKFCTLVVVVISYVD